MHLTAPRGRVLKKCSDHYLKNQCSDFDVHTFESFFGIRSKEVDHENLIEGRIQQLWPKMSVFPWFFPDGVQWKLDISRQNNFHKKSNTTFGLEGLHLVVKVSDWISGESSLRKWAAYIEVGMSFILKYKKSTIYPLYFCSSVNRKTRKTILNALVKQLVNLRLELNHY